MLIVFVAVLAATGAAHALKGRALRGLLVILTANVAGGLGAAASTRWGWLAFSSAMSGIGLLGIAAARNVPDAPPPAPPEPERDPDYCWTHKTLEPQEDR